MPPTPHPPASSLTICTLARDPKRSKRVLTYACRNQGNGGYGQNIDAAGYSNPVQGWSESSVIAYAITDGWYYGEVNNFESFYGQPSPPMSGPEYLHFTQVVWKGTQTIGCAAQYCPYGTVLDGSYGWFSVCNYGPEGESQVTPCSDVVPLLTHVQETWKAHSTATSPSPATNPPSRSLTHRKLTSLQRCGG
jgi:hypothetical protein